ncbi:MAG: phenylalanine--tRNA ligase subunit alpha [Bacteroidetes bacterium]|nr:phenylalanine--tRNA ligase subunit alpha [Bacteroidota bacterium]
MFENLDVLKTEIENYPITSSAELEQFRIRFLGTKNILKDVFTAIKDIPGDQKKNYGQQVNALKEIAENKFESFNTQLNSKQKTDKVFVDLTLPADIKNPGARHPITIVRDELVDIFSRIGYVVIEGPEIEDDWHNFTALNTPEDHPARDMQDTFYIQTNPDIVLRTHTSNVQIRVMENTKPPFRVIAPGRCYRNETISARAHVVFHQLELFYVDEGVSFADLKQTLSYLAKELFGEKTSIRLRPSYFPFTEPSAELDVSCFVCNQAGCAICKYSGWVEIGGAGMIDPQVLENCGIDSEKYTGFAFGMGIERMAILKFRINDIRLFTENDLRFLKQFEGI